MRKNPRALALDALYQVLKEHHSLDDILTSYTGLSPQDAALVKFLCYGVLREYEALSFILQQLIHKKLKEKELQLKLILLLGIFQLKNSRIPAHAVLHETVALTQNFNLSYASGFCNAIFRRFLREQKNLLQKLKRHVFYEHPEWLLKKLQSQYPSQWEAMIEANNTPAPLHLRVNHRQRSREDYLKILQEHHIPALIPASFSNALTLETPMDVALLPLFSEGAASVQDLAAQKAATLLDLKPGMKVLDACAAPGGKSCHILESADVALYCMDLSQKRLDLLQENLQRLHLKAQILVGDATHMHFEQLFDRILIDAPCSGTGVIRRHPDIKFLRQASDIPALHRLQVQMIQHLSKFLKPEGLLLYATCSVLQDENDDSIGAALQECSLQSISLPLDHELGPALLKTHYGYQFLPQAASHDGFYYAALKKI